MHAANRQLDGPGGVLLTWTGCWIASGCGARRRRQHGRCGAWQGAGPSDARHGRPGATLTGRDYFRPHSAGERHPPQRGGKRWYVALVRGLGQLLPSFSAVSSSRCRHVERAARGAPAADTQGSAGGSALTAEAPLPAGPTPSQIARMVCSDKAQREIGEILGVEANVSQPT